MPKTLESSRRFCPYRAVSEICNELVHVVDDVASALASMFLLGTVFSPAFQSAAQLDCCFPGVCKVSRRLLPS